MEKSESSYCQAVKGNHAKDHYGVETIEKIRIDLNPELRAEMMTKTGRRTVPQIYIGEKHVGGYDDLSLLDRSGELSTLLT